MVVIDRLARDDLRPIVRSSRGRAMETTQLAQWAGRYGPRGFVGVGGCRGNDPNLLLGYVAQALDGVRPIGGRVFDVLGSPTSSVPGSVGGRGWAAFAAMTALSPADVRLGSVCPLIFGSCKNEAGIGCVSS